MKPTKVMSLATGLVALGALCCGSTPAKSLTCQSGPFVIFFDADRAHLDLEDQKILDAAISSVTDCWYREMHLSGHTDTAELPEWGEKRLRTVRAYLAARGIPEDDIALQNFGSSQLRIPTGNGVQEKENRRVEVSLVSIGP